MRICSQRVVIQANPSLIPPSPVFKVYDIFCSRLLPSSSERIKVAVIAHAVLKDCCITLASSLRGGFLYLGLGALHVFCVVHHDQCAIAPLRLYVCT